jgi:hypothetical protein
LKRWRRSYSYSAQRCSYSYSMHRSPSLPKSGTSRLGKDRDRSLGSEYEYEYEHEHEHEHEHRGAEYEQSITVGAAVFGWPSRQPRRILPRSGLFPGSRRATRNLAQQHHPHDRRVGAEFSWTIARRRRVMVGVGRSQWSVIAAPSRGEHRIAGSSSCVIGRDPQRHCHWSRNDLRA